MPRFKLAKPECVRHSVLCQAYLLKGSALMIANAAAGFADGTVSEARLNAWIMSMALEPSNTVLFTDGDSNNRKCGHSFCLHAACATTSGCC